MSVDVHLNGAENSLNSPPSKRKKRKHDEHPESLRKKRRKSKQTDMQQAASDRLLPLHDQASQDSIQREWEDLGREENWENFQSRLLNGFDAVAAIPKERKKKKRQKETAVEAEPFDLSEGAKDKPDAQFAHMNVAEQNQHQKKGKGKRRQTEKEVLSDSEQNVRVNGNRTVLEEEKKKKRKKKESQVNIGTEVTSSAAQVDQSVDRETQISFDNELEESGRVYDTNNDTAEVDSPVYQTRLSFYVPVAPIAISTSTGLSSVITEHLSPLLLTYSPAARGTVLAFSDPSISTYCPSESLSASNSNSPAFAVSAEEYGVSWLWLTATFLVFRPVRGQILRGHLMICSSDFLTLSLYNFFLVSIDRNRIPKSWTWHPSSQEASQNFSRKPNRRKYLMDDNGDDPVFSSSQPTLVSSTEDSGSSRPSSQDTPAVETEKSSESEGYFTYPAPDGRSARVSGFLRFRVVDLELVPGAKGQGRSLRIDGTLLDPEDEEKVVEAGREEWERVHEVNRRKLRHEREKENVVMSGALVDADWAARARSRSAGVHR